MLTHEELNKKLKDLSDELLTHEIKCFLFAMPKQGFTATKSTISAIETIGICEFTKSSNLMSIFHAASPNDCKLSSDESSEDKK